MQRPSSPLSGEAHSETIVSRCLGRTALVDRHQRDDPSKRLLAALGQLAAVPTLGLGPFILDFLTGAVQFFALQLAVIGSFHG
jgi:hypothetical protein